MISMLWWVALVYISHQLRRRKKKSSKFVMQITVDLHTYFSVAFCLFWYVCVNVSLSYRCCFSHSFTLFQMCIVYATFWVKLYKLFAADTSTDALDAYKYTRNIQLNSVFNIITRISLSSSKDGRKNKYIFEKRKSRRRN